MPSKWAGKISHNNVCLTKESKQIISGLLENKVHHLLIHYIFYVPKWGQKNSPWVIS